MIEVVALRLFRLSGVTFREGETLFMTECQFTDLSSIGLVARKPQEIAVSPAITAPRKRGFLRSEPK